MGASGFRIDAAKHMSPEDLTAILKLVQTRMGGRFPTDFFVWLEVLTGDQVNFLWSGSSWYGSHFTDLLVDALGSYDELNKVKFFDGGYPSQPWQNTAIPSNRIVIQNDDHDSQSPDFNRDFGHRGCVLVKSCPVAEHRNYEIRLFIDPYEIRDKNNDWPIRIILSSFYHTYGVLGVPDGY